MEEIYKQVADELGVSEYLVETVVKHKYSWIRKQLGDIQAPAILDNGFGTFFLPEHKIKTYLDKLKEDSKGTDEEEKEITKYTEIYNGVSSYNNNKKIVNKRKKDE